MHSIKSPSTTKRPLHTLIFLGSPRKNANSESLCRAAAQGILHAGGTVEFIRLNTLAIRPCQACNGCDKNGVCILNDDMTELYVKSDAADRIILASPIYFYGLSAQAKTFGDRMQAQWARRYLQHKRFRPGEGRKGYFLSTAATKGKKLFDAAILTTRYIFDAMDMEYGGELVVRQVDERTAVDALSDELKRAEEFGRAIICNAT